MQDYSGREIWSKVPTDQRCRMIASVASLIAAEGERWTILCRNPQRVDPVETITAELFPLCSALKFIGQHGASLLRSRRIGWWGRPVWLWGVRSEIRRDPHGKVLVLGTWNYPLFLVGVQIAQALACGNEVLLKPAIGCESISDHLIKAFYDCGIPKQAIRVLDSSTQAATQAIDAGVDLIVMTGAATTGRAVLRRAAETLTPAILELSGCDAVIVLPGTDLDRAAKAIAFGLTFNSGASCIAPRRLIVDASTADPLVEKLRSRLTLAAEKSIHPRAQLTVIEMIQRSIDAGAVDTLGVFDAERMRRDGMMAPLLLDQVKPDDEIAKADLFAPVLSIIRVHDIGEATAIVNNCPYRLATGVFGPQQHALRLGSELHVGSVLINDLIVPTADPRVPFGGRGDSGFGITRGAEGLLAMTVPVVTSVRTGRWMPHLSPRQPTDAQTLLGALQLLYARSFADRWAGLKKLMASRRSDGEDDHSSTHSK